MLIKFFSNGKGAGAGPVGYLVADRVLAYDGNRDLIRDANGQPVTVTRDPLPEVLRGNPERTEALIDASRHQWTYRAGVISFADTDDPTEDQQAEVMDEFERLAFAGLDPEQYEVLWVRHRHEGRVELHFCTPRLELTTGKSFNIAPPGYQDAYDSLRDVMNRCHGWADPMELERAQEVRDTIEAPIRAHGRDELHAWILDLVSVGLITDRNSLLEALHDAGFDLPRLGKAYLTVRDPETGERWRMKGEVFNEGWQTDPSEPEVERGVGGHAPRAHRLDRCTTEGLQAQFESNCAKRAGYNRKRYPKLSDRDGEHFRDATSFDPALAGDLTLADLGSDLDGGYLDDGCELALDGAVDTFGVYGTWPDQDRAEGAGLDDTRPRQGQAQPLQDCGQDAQLHQDHGEVNEGDPNALRARLAHLRRAVGEGLRGINSRIERLGSAFDQQDWETDILLVRLRKLAHAFSSRVYQVIAWLAQRRGELQRAGRSTAEEFAISEGRRRKAEAELRCRHLQKKGATMARLTGIVAAQQEQSAPTHKQPLLMPFQRPRRPLSRKISPPSVGLTPKP
ncbi:relaxase/mobilization nuclease domain-containing protein [uncultured Pelagimonas sp.]|uniref:relaxase/mobilization nuclease domain-containing protein n=1 Tax=uncultured Pelagimonas sp. TaxID=1618102 RepID=UPI002623FF85|nr:relaxase/mobilization nuclease domain-containing protein [uncultured Pelagimonas sp.]